MSDAQANNSKPPPGVADATNWAGIKPEHKKLALRTAMAGLTTYLISRVMTSYSGTTLLFPKSWREIVIGLASFLGILMFELGHKRGESSIGLDQNHDEHINKPLRTRIWLTFGALFLSVCSFYLLRGYCVYHFDPTQWLTTRALADEDREQQIQATGDKTTANAVLVVNREAADKGRDAREERNQAKLDALVPEFVNRDQQLICLPFWLPTDDRRYVENIHEMRNDDGIRVILDEQPGLIINWLTSDARMNLHVTTLMFLTNYLLIITLATYLLGMRFDPVQSVWEALFGLG